MNFSSHMRESDTFILQSRQNLNITNMVVNKVIFKDNYSELTLQKQYSAIHFTLVRSEKSLHNIVIVFVLY